MKKNRLLIRVLAIVLAVLLVGGAVVSATISAFAEADAAQAERDRYEIDIVYMEEQQALHVTQRLVYHNRQAFEMDRVLFSAAGNMYRREGALAYASESLTDVFPEGYVPAGIELMRVEFDGQAADWGYVDEAEMVLRVGCALAPGESGEFLFEYYLLLSRNCSMLGEYDTDVRLSGFYFAPGLVNGDDEEFVVNTPLSFTRWLLTGAADYSVTLAIPENYLPAATGSEALAGTEDRVSTWRFEAENVREFAVSFGKRWRESTAETESGVTVRLLSNRRNDAGALATAVETIELYEEWLGAFPMAQIDLVQSDYPIDALNFPGAVWLPEALFDSDGEMAAALRFCLAQQYVGMRAYAEPVADAWLSDVPCSYLALLAVEELEGYDAFLAALNDAVLESLRITIPGGLNITTSADLFTASEYALVVRGRGTVVMHELRLSMGREAWIAGIRQFYEMGLDNRLLGEMDFVQALDEATGGDWETFLTDWLFNVGDYIDQQIEFYE